MESERVENWLSRVGEKTGRDYKYTLVRWLKWLKEDGGKFKDFTPDQLIEYQKSCDNGNCFEILDLVQRWVLSHKKHSFKTKWAYHQGVLSFFSHNRATLPQDRAFKIRGDKPKTVNRLTEEQVKKIVLVSNPMYQACYMVMASTSMACQEVIYWSNTGWDDLRAQLLAGESIIQIEMPGRKANRNETPYYTLLGGDGLRALKGYLGEDLPRHRPAIFLNALGKPLTKTTLIQRWIGTLRRLDIVPTPPKRKANEPRSSTGVRYGFGIHNLRDLWRTNWSRARCAEDIGEFLMGHTIDPLGYNQIYRDTEYVKAEYRKALKHLNYLSHNLDLTENTSTELLERITELESQLEQSIRVTPVEKRWNEDLMQMLESPEIREKFVDFLQTLAE